MAQETRIITVQPGGSSRPDLRYWWEEDANQKGEYNYSSTGMYGGSAVNVANQWGDAFAGFILTGPYGDSNIYFQRSP